MDFNRLTTIENYAKIKKWSKIKKFKIEKLLVHHTWRPMLDDIFKNKELVSKINKKINDDLDSLDDRDKLYPKRDFIFRAFQLTPLRKLKVVFIGQDPYFNCHWINNQRICQATGLSFSVPENIPIPSSLINIYSNLIKYEHIKERPKHGCLNYWALQGCLMLNTSLTVIDNQKNCHSEVWRKLTDDIIKYINKNCDYVVFVMWGAEAFKKVNIIDVKKHGIIVSSHPSGLSCNKMMGNHPAFCNVDHFGMINKYLKSKNLNQIDWCIV